MQDCLQLSASLHMSPYKLYAGVLRHFFCPEKELIFRLQLNSPLRVSAVHREGPECCSVVHKKVLSVPVC